MSRSNVAGVGGINNATTLSAPQMLLKAHAITFNHALKALSERVPQCPSLGGVLQWLPFFKSCML